MYSADNEARSIVANMHSRPAGLIGVVRAGSCQRPGPRERGKTQGSLALTQAVQATQDLPCIS